MKTIFTAACGDAAAVQGSCRVIDRPDDPALTSEAMLAPHRARTPCRMRAQSTVLAIQDGSDLNFATHRACKGLGVIAKTKGFAGTLGLHRPTTFAVNADGVPLGLPRIAFEAPGGQADTDKPTADKKTQRWRIEEYHRILTSGCDVEKIARTTPERVKRAVTINAVIAWRLATLTLLGRETPERPAATMLSETEINLLHDDAISHNPVAADRAEHTPLSLGSAIMLIARLGGYLNRKADAPPGHQIVREGYTRLAIGTRTMERFMDNGPKSPFYKQYAQREND